ncbi:LysR family transcriptional regulator [Rheinheimera salexigens]|uniref:LysR family transcriptional regulator n=1 Tax=Rheinheimera salexigens TaxID=1628148 RepID=A0A1E7Q3S7_9GAMM|nr:LysR family transcriptional regulator [Rheinheimera salexigens]OEY68770.1 LysR family transcriptional regulator [Rheinheimera salexigens]
MDRLEAMRAFVAVVTEGSFSQAATSLNLSPQLVSKYVSQLEKHIAVRLLNRTTRKVNLTEAGTEYFQHAQQILLSIDEMDQQLSGLQQNPSGTLKISAPVSFALKHLGSLITDFQSHHPNVNIDLQLSDRKVDIIKEGFDIALRIGQLKSSSLIAKYVAPIRLILSASPGYLNKYGTPLVAEDLKHHRYLHYSYSEMAHKDGIYQWLKTKNLDSRAGLSSNNGDVLIAAAIAGAGLALQPTFIASEAISNGQLIPVLTEHSPEPFGLYAVYAHRKLLPNKVRCFIDFIDGYFGNPPHWDKTILDHIR